MNNRGRPKELASGSIVVVGALVLALAAGIGLVFLLRGGAEPPSTSGGDDRIIPQEALGVDQNGRLSADFDHLLLGFSPTGHDYPFPNENRPREYQLAVKSQPSNGQLDGVFAKDYVVSLGGDFYEGTPFGNLSFEYPKTRNIFISEIAVYDYYEGIEADYDAWWESTYRAAFHDDEDDLNLEAATRFEASWRQTYSYGIPPLPDYDQPLTSFGPGYYRVGVDISPGTYQAEITVDKPDTVDKQASPADYVIREYSGEYDGWLSYRLTPPPAPASPTRPVDDADQIRFKTNCNLFYSVDNPEVDNVEHPDWADDIDPDDPPTLIRPLWVDDIVSGSILEITIGPHVTNFAVGMTESDCGGASWQKLD